MKLLAAETIRRLGFSHEQLSDDMVADACDDLTPVELSKVLIYVLTESVNAGNGRCFSAVQRNDAGTLLNGLRRVADLREAIAAIDKLLSKEKAYIESAIVKESELSGSLAFKNEAMSVSVKDGTSFRVDPEKWNSIYDWAVRTGNHGLLYKQVSSKVLSEIVASGGAMPEGITMDSFKKISARRL